ncbi:MAG: YfhO family protein [Ruminococcus sp.]|nr:YfhO family protein [Ruminococcus sp.]
MSKRLSLYSEKRKFYALRAFLIALVTAAIIFIPFIIFNGGIFYYYGDFNVQEIPFYQLVHDAVKNGQLGWSHTTDLGSDLLSSYSFYLMGSPFFWMTLPFSNEFVPYLIGPLLILKFACASLTAYLYLRRYVQNKNFAVIGGLLYAFSGFSIYNVFFFHFHEPMIVFPLLLAALDSFLYDKKRGIFALAVFSACVVNYYFFTGQVLFVIMYYFMLVCTKTYKFKFSEFLLLAVEVLIGFAATAFLLLPSVLGIMGNPRLDSLPKNWDALVYDVPQRYWLMILAFFFPADMPAFPVFTPDSNCKWASVAGWIPLFGMTGVIGYLQIRKRTWIKKLITLLVLCAFVPVLNSAFQMFNTSIFYTRWFYMLVLVFTLATIRALEEKQVNWNRAIRWSAGITVGLTLFLGLMPSVEEADDGTEVWSLGVAASVEQFWVYATFALVSILAFVLIIKKFKRSPQMFTAMLLFGTLMVSIVSSMLIIAVGAFSSSTTETIKNDIMNKRDGITIKDIDDDAVRCDFYECVDNTQMFWKLQSINCFQSSVSPSIMKFYDSLGVTRDVASRPDTNYYGIRSFLSCKYLFDYVDDGEKGSAVSFLYQDGDTKMPYWKHIATQNGFDIYENECYIPMGFTYDSFITMEEFDRIDNVHRSETSLYAMVLTKEQMKKYSEITEYSDKKYSLLYGKNPTDFISVVDNYKYGRDAYKKACETRKANSCSDFSYTNTGFKAVYDNTNGKENLLFFSIPYSKGFTAKVNGKAVDVEEVNNGFMAVKIPADTKCDVVFEYETPGFSLGLKITITAFCAFAVYCLAVYGLKRKFRLKKNQKVK